ncbi:MAG TPA: hypothetical protein VFH88_14695 [Candidatus Krumholzibacteria bacterium]|nr:hypothetical protein [Candidatus Krumholzibacteria bacterium]
MTKSTWMRWGLCTLTVVAMLALLGGCAKKEKAATENTQSTETSSTETSSPAMAGTYSAAMAGGTTSLMLNDDMSASFSMQAAEDQPAQVENGSWAAGSMPNTVDVTLSKAMADTTMSMTLNFMASGDTLALTNGDMVGMSGLKLMKQQ